MKNKPTSYARFYALLRQMQGDREQIKETLILQFTKGRTTSLREMQKDEYEAMCRAMEAVHDETLRYLNPDVRSLPP